MWTSETNLALKNFTSFLSTHAKQKSPKALKNQGFRVFFITSQLEIKSDLCLFIMVWVVEKHFYFTVIKGVLPTLGFQCLGSAKPPLRNSWLQARNLRRTHAAGHKAG